MTTLIGQLFPLGQTTWTPAARAVLVRHNVDPADLLQRHSRGDWGELAKEDCQANDLAMKAGSFILSVYRVGTERVYIATEPSFRTTTIMLPEEY